MMADRKPQATVVTQIDFPELQQYVTQRVAELEHWQKAQKVVDEVKILANAKAQLEGELSPLRIEATALRAEIIAVNTQISEAKINAASDAQRELGMVRQKLLEEQHRVDVELAELAKNAERERLAAVAERDQELARLREVRAEIVEQEAALTRIKQSAAEFRESLRVLPV